MRVQRRRRERESRETTQTWVRSPVQPALQEPNSFHCFDCLLRLLVASRAENQEKPVMKKIKRKSVRRERESVSCVVCVCFVYPKIPPFMYLWHKDYCYKHTHNEPFSEKDES